MPAISGTLPTIVPGVTRLTVAYDASSWNPTTNASATSIVLNATGSVGNLTWTGATNGTWDIVGTNNWQANPIPVGSDPNKFYQADNVTFDDSGSILNILARCGRLTQQHDVNASTKAYSFTGGGFDRRTRWHYEERNRHPDPCNEQLVRGTSRVERRPIEHQQQQRVRLRQLFRHQRRHLGNTSGSAVVVAIIRAKLGSRHYRSMAPATSIWAPEQSVRPATSGSPRTFNIVANTLTIGRTHYRKHGRTLELLRQEPARSSSEAISNFGGCNNDFRRDRSRYRAVMAVVRSPGHQRHTPTGAIPSSCRARRVYR